MTETNSVAGVNTEIMTVHKALATLKILSDRIEKECDSLKVCIATTANKMNHPDAEKFLKNGTANLKSIQDMISRYRGIKSAIVMSNALTRVNILGEEYTVAEVIEMKNTYIKFLKNLKGHAASQYKTAQDQKDRMDAQASINGLQVLGLSNKSTDISAAETNETYMAFIKNNGGIILEVTDTAELITKLQNFIDEFTAEADSALSVSNAVTTINVNYKLGGVV